MPRIALKNWKLIKKLNNMQKLSRWHLDKMQIQVMPTKSPKNNANQRESPKNEKLVKIRVQNVFTNPNPSKKNLARLTPLPLKWKLLSKKWLSSPFKLLLTLKQNKLQSSLSTKPLWLRNTLNKKCIMKHLPILSQLNKYQLLPNSLTKPSQTLNKPTHLLFQVSQWWTWCQHSLRWCLDSMEICQLWLQSNSRYTRCNLSTCNNNNFNSITCRC